MSGRKMIDDSEMESFSPEGSDENSLVEFQKVVEELRIKEVAGELCIVKEHESSAYPNKLIDRVLIKRK